MNYRKVFLSGFGNFYNWTFGFFCQEKIETEKCSIKISKKDNFGFSFKLQFCSTISWFKILYESYLEKSFYCREFFLESLRRVFACLWYERCPPAFWWCNFGCVIVMRFWLRFWMRFYVTLALAALNFLIRCIALTALYHRCQRRLKKEKFNF